MNDHDTAKVSCALLANAGLDGFAGVIAKLEPLLNQALILAQIAVAVFTVIYIYKKTKAIKPSRRPCKHDR